MGFTISPKEYLHEKGITSMNSKNLRNTMGGDTQEEKYEASERGLPFRITEAGVQAELQSYIDEDYVPATSTLDPTDHRGYVYAAMKADHYHTQDDRTAGASIVHYV